MSALPFWPFLCSKKTLERLSIKFTSNSKREFVPRDQLSPLLVVYCSLFLLINSKFESDVCRLPYKLSNRKRIKLRFRLPSPA